jgi:HB1, ASXL, restriction endonuclease HTH domain
MATKKSSSKKSPQKPPRPRTIKVVEETANGQVVEATSPETSESKPRQSKAKAEPKSAQDKPLSAINAALKVLEESAEPLNTKQLVEAMEAKGYWKSPGGKTPHATLYSAILRELAKGTASRFVKTDRGHFTVNK